MSGPGDHLTTPAGGTGDETTVLPMVTPLPKATGAPKATGYPAAAGGDETVLIPQLTRSATPRAEESDRGLRNHRKSGRRGGRFGPLSGDLDIPQVSTSLDGELVVPLRPIRTERGYRSVYSALTRRTGWTVLRMASRSLGEGLITLGLIVLLLAAYEIWGVGAKVNAHQTDLSNQLAQEWGGAPEPTVTQTGPPPTIAPPAEGIGFAKLYIPRMRAKPWIVVQGVTKADIRYAPGHYPGTAMPGEIGNFSVAGHRLPAIFWDLDQVKPEQGGSPGDPIIVETENAWYVYTTVQVHIVTPRSVEVVAPVPNAPGVDPSVAMLTLTTCNPKGNNYQRLVVHARLDKTLPHDAGPPPEVPV